MLNTTDRLYDNLCRALDEASNEPLTSSSLDNIFKLINSLYKLEKMESPDYSLSNGSSYARGRRNYGYANEGRYANDGRYANENYTRNNYSRHNKEDVKYELMKLMQDVQDENVKMKIQNWIQDIE